MNQMEIFRSQEFGSIRILEEDGEYLFCGTDVATALGYSNPHKAVRDHTKGGTKRSLLTKGGSQATIFLPEGDVYRLIVHSKLPSAERFEKWVFQEVLPMIRKHGAYLTQEKLWEAATSPEALMQLCAELLAEREKNNLLQKANGELREKAGYFDKFIEAGHCTNLRITAKELDVPERRFIRYLLEQRFVYRSPSGCVLPYAKAENKGLFCVKDFYSNGHLGAYTLVTPEGKQLFFSLRTQILEAI